MSEADGLPPGVGTTPSPPTVDYRHICAAASIAYHGLKFAHEAANSQIGKKDDIATKVQLLGMRNLYLRHIMFEIANVAEVAGMAKSLYKDHADLGEAYKKIAKGAEFFKYIRNKFVGHLTPELTAKAFEWIPHCYEVMGDTDPAKGTVLTWFILETAINTYTDPASGHKIFDTETDLNYPPDRTRFLNYLGRTADDTLAYAELLITTSAAYVTFPDLKADLIPLAMKAGETDFTFLAKKR